MAEEASTAYPTISAPYVITDTDQAGLVMVLTTFFLVCIWMLFAIRLYIRLNINGPWKWDDTCVAIATVLSCVRSGIVYLEVHRGYGKSGELLGDLAEVSIGKAIFGDNILYFLAMFFSKCAVLLLCLRMTPKRQHQIAIGGIFSFSLIWCIASIMLISIKCSPAHPWVDLPGQCANIALRWKAICALDVITEASIFACSIYLVYGLHMSWYLKSIVILAFGIRLPTAIFSGIHLWAQLREIASSDPTLAGAVTTAWKQVELDFAICACTFSSLGAFLKPFENEMGPSRSDTDRGYALNNSQRSYQMNSLASGNHGKGAPKAASQTSVKLPILRPDAQAVTTSTAFNGSASDRMSVESNDSKKGIIMKQVQWTVDRGTRTADLGKAQRKGQ